MVPSTELQCHPRVGGTLIIMLACSQRANGASLTPHTLSKGISIQLPHIFYLTDEACSGTVSSILHSNLHPYPPQQCCAQVRVTGSAQLTAQSAIVVEFELWKFYRSGFLADGRHHTVI